MLGALALKETASAALTSCLHRERDDWTLLCFHLLMTQKNNNYDFIIIKQLIQPHVHLSAELMRLS